MPGSICKSSGERGAFGLVVSHGCPYNRCAFCDLYKCDTYREVSLDQVGLPSSCWATATPCTWTSTAS